MRKALIVVDYQNDFVKGGSLGFEGSQDIDQGIASLILDESFNDVIFTYDTHDENYLNTKEGKNLPIKHCVEGTIGHSLYGETKKAHEKRMLLTKSHVWDLKKNTFGCKDLIKLLENLDAFDEIHLVGLVSNICLISNAIIAKSVQPEARIVIHKDLTGSYDSELHECALKVMGGLQMDVI